MSLSAVLGVVWIALHLVVAVPVIWVFVQTLVARVPTSRRPAPEASKRGRVAVLVPAHNESSGIIATLASIQPQLQPGDQILVVADNCNDDTAAVARAHGAQVVERQDTSRRGKGYALDHGMKHLAQDTPDWVLICDADCELAVGSLDQLLSTSLSTGQPTQALYLMTTAPGASLQQRFSEFAWRLKNQARPLGGLRLGAPCQLMGTGMLFAWKAIHSIPLASGHIVEDMQMGVDLALAGTPPRFEPNALVTSRFPESASGASTQRARWEHGHLATLLRAGPRLITQGLARGRLAVAAMGVDLMVPPLALLVMTLLSLVALNALLWFLSGWSMTFWSSLVLLALMACAVFMAWSRFGHGTVTGREMVLAIGYALRKIPLYLAFFVRRQTDWVRTKRDGE
jgi:cellulose synthase/poly-beta-1,6-N-acetylglucosamine synthase-like glycosyltransferase